MKNNVPKDYNLNTAYEDTENEILADKVKVYEGEFNKPQPNFKGIPPNYYPNTVLSIICQFLALFPLYIVCGLLMWGFLTWGLDYPRSYAWVSFGCFMLYLVLIIILVFFGSSERGKKEREYIEHKIKTQKEEKEKKKAEEQKQREMLEKYRHKKLEEKNFGI